MAILYRLVMDFVSKEELSEARTKTIAREAVNNLHVILVEPEDEVHDEIIDKFSYVHVHDAVNNEYCAICNMISQDDRNGDEVLANN